MSGFLLGAAVVVSVLQPPGMGRSESVEPSGHPGRQLKEAAFERLLQNFAARNPKSILPTHPPRTLSELWSLFDQMIFAEGWNGLQAGSKAEAQSAWLQDHTIRPKGYNSIFMGDMLQKYPSDLWNYQEIFWRVQPDIVIELGTLNGAAAAYYAMILSAIKPDAKVITVDLKKKFKFFRMGQRYRKLPFVKERVEFLNYVGGDLDPECVSYLQQRTKGKRTIVFIDSNHDAEYVARQLPVYGAMVSPGSYLIVEDSNNDIFNCQVIPPPDTLTCSGGDKSGSGTALRKWYPTQKDFVMEKFWSDQFHVSQNHEGFLRKVDSAASRST